MVDFEYTKINKIYEVNNCMCHNYYYIFHGRIYNKEHTRYRKFKYVEWFDIFDVQEFFDKDWVTEQDIKDFVGNLENTYLLCIEDYNDTKHLKEFYDYCNETIENYNKVI